jgi:hypothetical protein
MTPDLNALQGFIIIEAINDEKDRLQEGFSWIPRFGRTEKNEQISMTAPENSTKNSHEKFTGIDRQKYLI